MSTIRVFVRQNFSVIVDAMPEECAHDETSETRDKLDSGEWVIFCARVRVLCHDREVAAEYLGNCIYESFEAFAERGGYMRQMVNEACARARAELVAIRGVYVRGVTA